MLLPGFLSAMIAGVLITNLADAFKYKLDFAPIETRRGAGAAALPGHGADGDAADLGGRHHRAAGASTW